MRLCFYNMHKIINVDYRKKALATNKIPKKNNKKQNLSLYVNLSHKPYK